MSKEQGKETVEHVDGAFKPGITTEPQQEVPQIPTTEEQTATLQEQLNELKTKYEQADKGLRSAQATLTQKDRLLKEKENVRDEIETLKNMVKILAVRGQVQEEDTNDFESTAKRKLPDIDKAFQEIEQRQKAQEYQRQVQDKIDAIKERVESSGLTENDSEYWEIYKLATSATPADFRLADIKLKKLESEKEKTPVDTKPTDEIAKRLEALEKENERLKKIVSGELDVEKGLPSGASANEAEIRKAFRENPRNTKARADYLELQRTKTK